MRFLGTGKVVARPTVGRDGRFAHDQAGRRRPLQGHTVDAPAGERAALYRLRTRVRRSAASTKLFETFTLPRGVDF